MQDTIWHLFLPPLLPILALLCWMRWHIHKRDKRSRRPFDAMSRPAGWSLQNRLENLMFDFSFNIMMAVVVAAFACTVIAGSKGPVWPYLLIGFCGSSIMIHRSIRTLKTAANHRLGLLGEQVVGKILDQLSSDTIRVFHDLDIREPGRKPWNVDHVVLTPAGVYCIETKTRRKPIVPPSQSHQGHKLIFDGQLLRFPPPMKPDRHGLDQALNNAKWLAAKLSDLNGTTIPVTPVLVFPGWWVETTARGPVTVVNPHQLPSLLATRTAKLPADRLRAIATQLEERCRIDLSQPI